MLAKVNRWFPGNLDLEVRCCCLEFGLPETIACRCTSGDLGDFGGQTRGPILDSCNIPFV